MNRAQLDALLAAGLITKDQHAAALTTATGSTIVARPALSLELAADDVAADGEERVIRGVASKYDELIPSHQMMLHKGSLVSREPLKKNKLLRDHDHGDPLGYLLEFDTDTLEVAYYVAEGENGDRALREAADGLRDGLSVGFSIREYDFDDDWVLHVRAADFYETSLCAIPAVADAGVTNVAAALASAHRKESHIMNREQLAAALAAGTITQAQHDAALAALEANGGSIDALALVRALSPAPSSEEQELAAGPKLNAEQPVPIVVGATRKSLKQVTDELAAAFNTGDRGQITLALADIIPADDGGQAFLRDDWQGELWRAENESRTWIDAVGAPQALTTLKGKGWRWEEEPEVEEYAGNKTEVASNEISTTEAEFTAFRIAAGWDVDRAFMDFGDPEFQRAFWAAVMRDYKRKSNNGVRTRILAAAQAPGGTVTTGGVVAVTKQLIRDIRAVGGKANRVFLGDELFSELEDLDTEKLPLWLKNAALGLDIAEGTADVATLRIVNDPALAPLQIAGFDNRGITVREKSPLQVEALNIPHGGVDLGFYSYLRVEDHDPRVIVKRTYAPV